MDEPLEDCSMFSPKHADFKRPQAMGHEEKPSKVRSECILIKKFAEDFMIKSKILTICIVLATICSKLRRGISPHNMSSMSMVHVAVGLAFTASTTY